MLHVNDIIKRKGTLESITKSVSRYECTDYSEKCIYYL